MTTFTSLGIPKPEITDRLADGWDAIGDVADAVDALLVPARAGLPAWTAFTPIYSGFTVGNATVKAFYTQTGKTVTARVFITLGSTSVVTAALSIGLPVNAHADYPAFGSTAAPMGPGWAYDSSAAARFHCNAHFWNTGAKGSVFLLTGANVTVGNATPFAPAVGDQFGYTVTYEAA